MAATATVTSVMPIDTFFLNIEPRKFLISGPPK